MSTNNSWSSFDSYREMKVVSDGKVLVVRPSDTATIVPLFCPLCEFPLQNSDDSIAFRKMQCCDKCWSFARGNKAELPPEQWQEYLEERQNRAKPLFKLK